MRTVTKVVITAHAAAGFGGTEVGGIAVDPEDHVACFVLNGGIGVGGAVV